MRALLDINVLLALLDRDHIDHGRAHEWLDANIRHGWASCALTENGFVRIITQPRYPNAITPAEAASLLKGATQTDHHQFWSCDISLLDAAVVDHDRLLSSRQITDAYLVALAKAHHAMFATFDTRIVPEASRDDGSSLCVI